MKIVRLLEDSEISTTTFYWLLAWSHSHWKNRKERNMKLLVSALQICRLMGLQKLSCLLCLIENSYLNVILSFDCAATNRDLNVIPSLVFTDFSGFCEWNVGLLMGCYSSKPEKKTPGYEDPTVLAAETPCKHALSPLYSFAL